MKKEKEQQQTSAESKYEILMETLRIGSISKAAELLNYTQSGLTYTLNAIESDLGVAILRRDHKGVSLTEEGEELEPYLQAVINSEKALRNRIRELVISDSERIRIGAIQSIAKYCLPQVIMDFKEEYPNANIIFRVGGGMEIPQLVKQKELDIGIIDLNNAGDLDSVILSDEQIYLAVPQEWGVKTDAGALSPDALLNRPMLYLANPKNAGVLVMKNKPLQNKIMVSSDGDTILSMVHAGMGFALLSKRYMADCPEGVEMYPPDPPVTRTIGAVASSIRELHPLARKFITKLKDHPILNAV